MGQTVVIREYADPDQREIIELWKAVFPDAPAHNLPHRDIQTKLAIQPELFFVAVFNGRIIGTVMAGFDGHRGWVYYVAVHPNNRRQGIGTALMEKAEAALAEMGCPKLNLQIRTENSGVQAFYELLGYVVEDRISMGKPLKRG